MSDILGIDLGTTNSCVAVIEGDRATVIGNAEGNRTTPSVVALSAKGERLVGELAKRQAITNPEHTIFAVKRLMGQPKDAPIVARMKEFAPYKIVAEEQVNKIEAGGKRYLPEEVSAMVLQKMRETAEETLGRSVNKAIVTVPAYFNDSQRQATKNAGRIAGLDVLRIINEPTAAALSYGLGRADDKTIAVYDLGGGTFDISILDVRQGVFRVLATAGNTFLGGEDFDFRIMSWAAEQFKNLHGVDLLSDPMASQRLKDAAEEAKQRLSGTATAEIQLPFVAKGKKGEPLHLSLNLTREIFNGLVKDLVNETLACCEAAITEAGLTPNAIDEVLLVGGQTRSPIVGEQITRFFGKGPLKGVNPDEAVATGAAIQGGILLKRIENMILVDVTPMSLGIEITKGRFVKLVEKNSPVPTRASRIVTTVKNKQRFVTIHVLQGEGESAKLNHSLGKFDLVGIAPLPAGEPQILVSFNIDSNGIFRASAKDLGTGLEQAIRISDSCVVPDAEIERMVLESQLKGNEHRIREELSQLKARIAQIKGSLEETMANLPRKVDKHLKAALKEAIKQSEGFNYDIDLTTIATFREDVSLFEKNASNLMAAATPDTEGAPALKSDEAE